MQTQFINSFSMLLEFKTISLHNQAAKEIQIKADKIMSF